MSRSLARVVPLHQSQEDGKVTASESEVDKLIKSAEKVGRHGHRDATLILIAYLHALRTKCWENQLSRADRNGDRSWDSRSLLPGSNRRV